MKKLPKKIKIGYAIFKVKHVAKKSRHVKDMGETEFETQKIKIFGNQKNSEFANTLLHEVLHAVNYIFNIEFRRSKEEEKYVRHYANALITLFKDNPDFLLWLKDKLDNEETHE